MSNDTKLWALRGLNFILLSIEGSVLLKVITIGFATHSEAVHATLWFVLFCACCVVNMPVYVWYRKTKTDRWADHDPQARQQADIEILAEYAKQQQQAKEQFKKRGDSVSEESLFNQEVVAATQQPDAKVLLRGVIAGTGVHIASIQDSDGGVRTFMARESGKPGDRPYAVYVPAVALGNHEAPDTVPVGQPQTMEHYLGAQATAAISGVAGPKVSPYAGGFTDATTRSAQITGMPQNEVVTVRLTPDHQATIGMGEHWIPITEQ